MSSPEARRAVILGGGVAGITAAFLLRDRGYDVELLEGHRQLGGRAFTLPTPDGRIAADNGPHVMLGCYRRFRELLRRIGSEQLFDRPPALRLGYVDRDGRLARLSLLPGPAPLTMPLGVLGLGLLPWGARLRALLGFGAVLLGARRGEDLGSWLRRRGQAGAPREVLWEPLVRAIMNAEPEAVDARSFLYTLRRAFLGSGRSAAMWSPTAGWGAVIGEPAERALRDAGVRLRLGSARVRGLQLAEGRVAAVELAGGDHVELAAGDLLVSALPWHVVGRLLPEQFGGVTAALPGAPIVSVYFEHVDPHDAACAAGLPADPVVALIGGGPFDFLCRRPGDLPGRAAVLSGGGRDLGGLDAAAQIDAARAQLARHFPAAGWLQGARTRLAKESRATIVVTPGATRPVPGPVAGLDNLRVCGDWTETGLPSTLEGAAESAHRALVGC